MAPLARLSERQSIYEERLTSTAIMLEMLELQLRNVLHPTQFDLIVLSVVVFSALCSKRLSYVQEVAEASIEASAIMEAQRRSAAAAIAAAEAPRPVPLCVIQQFEEVCLPSNIYNFENVHFFQPSSTLSVSRLS